MICKSAIAATFACLLLIGSQALAHAEGQGEPVSVVLVLDTSGSNHGALGTRPTDPLDRRCTAARLFADLLDRDDQIGLVAFSTQVNLVQPVQTASNLTARLRDFLSICTASGDTNYSAALGRARELLEDDKSPNRRKLAIFLTDGEPTTGGGPNEIRAIATEFGRRGWPIYPIALNVAVDPALLADIADRSGGKFLQAERAELLPDRFQQIFAGLKGGTMIDPLKVCSGQTSGLQVPSYVNRAVVTVVHPSTVRVSVEPPRDGQVARREGTGSAAEGVYYEIYDVLTPQGKWDVRVTGQDCTILFATTLIDATADFVDLARLQPADRPIDLRLRFRIKPPNGEWQDVDRAKVEVTAAYSDGSGHVLSTQTVQLSPTSGSIYSGRLPATNRPSIVALERSVTLDNMVVYRDLQPQRMELVTPPVAELRRPASQQARLQTGDSLPIELSVMGSGITGVKGNAVITGQADKENVPLTRRSDGTYGGDWVPKDSGDYQIGIEATAQVKSPLLGLEGDVPLSVKSAKVHIDLVGPQFVVEAPGNSVAIRLGQRLPVEACFRQNGKPFVAPEVKLYARLTDGTSPEQAADLSPTVNQPGCYTTSFDIRRGGTYNLSVKAVGSFKGIPVAVEDNGQVAVQLKVPQIRVLDPPSGGTGDSLPIRASLVIDGETISAESGTVSVAVDGPNIQGQNVVLRPDADNKVYGLSQ